MAFCSNCGSKLAEGAKFCNKCGISIVSDECVERKQEWAGKVVKCPACGAEISSFTAICSSCGHELNSQSVSSSLKKLVSDLDEIERTISLEPSPPEKGWKTWSNKKRVLWLALNVAMFFIPIAVKYLFPMVRRTYVKKEVKTLTALERRKAAIIENHVFPNEREALVEGMLFVKAKIDFLATEKADKKTVYWMRLWHDKANQIYKKANILLPDDAVIMGAYNEISGQEERINKRIMTQGRIAGALLLILCVVCFFIHPIFEGVRLDIEMAVFSIRYNMKESYAAKHFKDTFSWPSTGLSTFLPEPETNVGEIDTNTASEFAITLYSVSSDDFISYKNACKRAGFVNIDTDSDSCLYAFNSEDYGLDIIYTETYNKMTVSINAPVEGTSIRWPQAGIGSYLPIPNSLVGFVSWEHEDSYSVTICNTTKAEYKEYIDLCMDAGFTVDYTIGDDYFGADNNAGDYVRISWEVPNQMEISISGDYSGPKNSPISENASHAEAAEKPMSTETPEPMEEYIWPASGLSTYLPVPNNGYGVIEIDDDSSFELSLYQATSETLQTYMEQCKEKGFTVDPSKDKRSYEAYNSEGCWLRLYLDESSSELSITVYDPVKRNKLNWSAVPMMKKVPTPPSNIGEVGINLDWTFSAYILDVTYEEYTAYVDKCIKKGFKNDFMRYDNWFSGEDKNGYELRVSWERNSTIYISVTNYDLF